MVTKLDAWDARLKLFRAVVASILLYEAWGLNQREIVEKVQNRFKSLLQLPINTPGYMICMETDTTKLTIESLKRALALLEKINLLKEDRFPKKTLDNLIALDLSGSNDGIGSLL